MSSRRVVFPFTVNVRELFCGVFHAERRLSAGLSFPFPAAGRPACALSFSRRSGCLFSTALAAMAWKVFRRAASVNQGFKLLSVRGLAVRLHYGLSDSHGGESKRFHLILRRG